MKVKQKKLKAENFRYVTKEIIKNPMIYLEDFFGEQTEIAMWLRDIHLLVGAATDSDMAYPKSMEIGYDCRKLIEQLEVAYVIFKQCNLRKHPAPLRFFVKRADFLAYMFHGTYTFQGKADPADTLSRFFSYQSLTEWYRTFDTMMLYLADHVVTSENRYGDEIIVIRELLLRLARAMSDIYENEGIPVRVPSYFVACPTPTSIRGQGELSNDEAYLDEREDEKLGIGGGNQDLEEFEMDNQEAKEQ